MNNEYCKKVLLDLARKKNIGNLCNYLSRDEKMKVLGEANKLVRNIYTFNKPWDMERCKTEYQLNPLEFNVIHNDDEEWCFMLNRMDYLSHLYLASLIENDVRFVQRAKEIVQLWVEKHTEIKPEISTRTLDTAIRVVNILDTIQVLLHFNLLNDAELDSLLESIRKQVHYLKENYILKYKLSNWGSIQTASILTVLPLIDENYSTNSIMEWANEEYVQQMKIQVYEDGMHWEQSTMYHIEVLNVGLRYMYSNKLMNLETNAIIEETLKKMAIAVINQTQPKGTIEMFGDSDSVSVDDVSVRASVLFLRNYFRGKKPPIDAENLFHFGTDVVGILNEISELSSECSLIFDGHDSGMFVLKNSLSNDSSFTMFTNGSLGSGHGHCDNLHLSIAYKGEAFLVDSGRFTYREDHLLREKLKRVDAHNSMDIDGIQHSIPKGSWGYTKFCNPLKNIVKHDNEVHYYEGAILASDPQQFYRRRLLVIDEGIWLIVDDVIEAGIHKLNQLFHIDVDASVEEKDGFILLQKKSTSLKLISNASAKVEPCLLSYNYNELVESEKIVYQTDFENKGISAISIVDASIRVERATVMQGDEDILDESVVTARKYILNDNESYILIVFHQEIFTGKKICTCEGIHFHAKVVVLHTLNGKTNVRRIKT